MLKLYFEHLRHAMKAICLLLAIFLCSAFLMHCKSDETQSSPLEALVGTWEASQIVFSDCLNPEEDGTLTCDPFCIRITINTDSTYDLIEFDDDGSQKTETGVVAVTANTILICESTEPNCMDPNTYTLDGDILLITEQEDDISGCQSVFTFERIS